MWRDCGGTHLTFAPSTIFDPPTSRSQTKACNKLAGPTPTCVWLRSRLPIPSGLGLNPRELAFLTRFCAWRWSKLLIPSGISTPERRSIGILYQSRARNLQSRRLLLETLENRCALRGLAIGLSRGLRYRRVLLQNAWEMAFQLRELSSCCT
jgi:hypothetical protein